MFMSRRGSIAVLFAVAAAAATVAAAPVLVRLSTVAPAGTTWDTALKQMGADWRKATDGRVTLRVTGGGAQGSEKTVLRNMRPEVNTVDASLLTSGGLAEIDSAFNVFGIPFFFQSDAEEQYVRGKLEPMLKQRLEARKFHLLAWGHGGWVQLFSTVPMKTLADVKRAKLFTGAGNTEMVNWYTSNGFNPVPLESTAIAQGLATGIIQATPMPPYGAVALQISRTVKYMLDVNVDPLIGALIMTDATWNKILPEDQPKVLAAAKAMEQTLQVEVPKQDADSVTAMQAKGLTVTRLDQAGLAAFRAEADKLVSTMRGPMVPADVYDLAVQAREEYRRK
jgi:TRAP-type C4-dicarboxylate transport system substrate-binding protein